MKNGGRIQRRPSRRDDSTRIVVQTDKQGWWSSLSEGTKRVVATFGAIAGMSLVTYLAYLYARKVVRDKRAKVEQTKSFGKDRHATWAKLFKQGIDNDGWWGTDVPLIRQTMREIPSQEDFDKVVTSYAKMYKGANMIADLTDDLTKLEYQEMMAIKNGKPKRAKDSKGVKIYDPTGWAKRIHAAVNYTWIGFMPGTDDDAIKAVFLEIPTRKAFYDTAKVYRKLYGVSLYSDLDGDLDWSWDWRAALKKKPPK
jgi:hypothetical protein